MGIWIDIGILTIILASVYFGYKKGLMGIAFKIISFIIAIILSILLYKPMGNFLIEKTPIGNNIQNAIVNYLGNSQMIDETTMEVKVKDEKNGMSSFIENYIGKIIEEIQTNEIKENTVIVIAKRITETIVMTLALLISFIVIKLLLSIIKVVIDQIAKVPVIKECNTIIGIVYGLVKGIFIVYLLLACILLISPTINESNIIKGIESSMIGKTMYQNNIILKLIFKTNS